MSPAKLLAALALAAFVFLVGRLIRRRMAAPPCRRTADDDFGDTAAGYHKEPPAWPVDDWPPEGQEEEETCPECNAVLIYGVRPDEEDEEPS